MVKSYTSREIIKILKDDGWYEVRVVGSHHHFRHPEKAGTTTVPHPQKDFPINTVKSIFKQAGIKMPAFDQPPQKR